MRSDSFKWLKLNFVQNIKNGRKSLKSRIRSRREAGIKPDLCFVHPEQMFSALNDSFFNLCNSSESRCRRYNRLLIAVSAEVSKAPCPRGRRSRPHYRRVSLKRHSAPITVLRCPLILISIPIPPDPPVTHITHTSRRLLKHHCDTCMCFLFFFP